MDINLKEKIEHEIARIEKLLSDAKPLLDLCKIKKPEFIEITATAQILHSFYNGVESVVILFLKSIFKIAFWLNSKNIIILRKDIKERMEKYMYFRHFIRHSYSSELKWSEMEILIKELEEIWKIIKIDFESFIKNN